MDTEHIVQEVFSISPKEVIPQFDTAKAIPWAKNRPPDFGYRLDDYSFPSAVSMGARGAEWETFDLDYVDITFGARAYFLCPCGSRVNRLYLPKNCKNFRCIKCHKLQYFLTTFNKHSIAGRQFYKMDRLQKLADCRESMDRILYNGKYTKRFNRFLKLCKKAGFYKEVTDAEGLMALIRG